MHVCVRLLDDYLASFLDYLDVSSKTIAAIHVALVVMDFYAAEWVYDNIVFELFHRNEKFLHSVFKQLRYIFENTVLQALEGVKDIALSILAGLIPMLPSPVKKLLDFFHVTKYLEKSLDKYSAREQKIKKE